MNTEKNEILTGIPSSQHARVNAFRDHVFPIVWGSGLPLNIRSCLTQFTLLISTSHALLRENQGEKYERAHARAHGFSWGVQSTIDPEDPMHQKAEALFDRINAASREVLLGDRDPSEVIS
jgi:hypothetical protein